MTRTRLWTLVMLVLAVGLFVGCGDDDDDASPDGDADADADADADTDADADLCPAGQPAGPLPVKECHAPEPTELGYQCDDVGPCTTASDCALVNTDACCHQGFVAVLATRAAALTAAVGTCENPDVICVSCPGQPDVDCVAGECVLVPPTCEGQGPSVMQCDWQCIDTAGDIRFCGDCDTRCGMGQHCNDGVCGP